LKLRAKIAQLLLMAVGTLLSLAGAAAHGAVPAVKPGEIVIDPPTLINLGFEWPINGDDNRNAKVDVSFRKKGTTEWRKAMPLMRLQGEHVYQGRAAVGEYIFNVVMPNMFAGSILDLEPGTEYEARFVMTDPDGVIGKATRLITVKTRPDPQPAQGGRVYHVYPVGWQGPKEPNSFTGLNCAYNYYCGGGDTSLTGRPRVKAGDIILVHAGVYKSLHARSKAPIISLATAHRKNRSSSRRPVMAK
jgi:hypothetical protein